MRAARLFCPSCRILWSGERSSSILSVAIAAAILSLVGGCRGISPAPRAALNKAGELLDATHGKKSQDTAALVEDLRQTLDDWAADLADSELTAAAAVEGGLTLAAAKKVLAAYQARQKATAGRVASLRSKLDGGAAYRSARQLMRDVGAVLEALERAKSAEDNLQDAAARAVEEAAKRGKRGGI